MSGNKKKEEDYDDDFEDYNEDFEESDIKESPEKSIAFIPKPLTKVNVAPLPQASSIDIEQLRRSIELENEEAMRKQSSVSSRSNITLANPKGYNIT